MLEVKTEIALLQLLLFPSTDTGVESVEEGREEEDRETMRSSEGPCPFTSLPPPRLAFLLVIVLKQIRHM